MINTFSLELKAKTVDLNADLIMKQYELFVIFVNSIVYTHPCLKVWKIFFLQFLITLSNR